MSSQSLPQVLFADDDLDDCQLIEDAILDSGLSCAFRFVHDGQALLEYLLRDASRLPAKHLPALIVLDLNMPFKDGREVIEELEVHPVLKGIPVVILSTSGKDAESLCRHRAVRALLEKPSRYEHLIDIVGSLPKYWSAPGISRLGE